MDAIDAIIARRQSARKALAKRSQSAHKASSFNATSKALQGGLTDKRDKSVVSNTTKLISPRG